MDACEVSQTVSKQSLRSNCFFPTLYFMQSGDRTISLTCHVLALPACYTWSDVSRPTHLPHIHSSACYRGAPSHSTERGGESCITCVDSWLTRMRGAQDEESFIEKCGTGRYMPTGNLDFDAVAQDVWDSGCGPLAITNPCITHSHTHTHTQTHTCSDTHTQEKEEKKRVGERESC